MDNCVELTLELTSGLLIGIVFILSCMLDSRGEQGDHLITHLLGALGSSPPPTYVIPKYTSTCRWHCNICVCTYIHTVTTYIDMYNNNNNRRLVTLAEHTSDHGRQTNSSTEEKGEQV